MYIKNYNIYKYIYQEFEKDKINIRIGVIFCNVKKKKKIIIIIKLELPENEWWKMGCVDSSEPRKVWFNILCHMRERDGHVD